MSRLIKHDRKSSILAGNLPQLDYYVLKRESFLTGLEDENPDALQVIEGLALPAYVILLPLPTDSDRQSVSAEELLQRYWGIRAEAEVARQWILAREAGGAHDFEQLEGVVGAVAAHEIASVERSDLRVLEEDEDREVVRSFVGVAARLGQFHPEWREDFYPAIENWDGVDDWIAGGGVDPRDAVERARPVGVLGTPRKVEELLPVDDRDLVTERLGAATEVSAESPSEGEGAGEDVETEKAEARPELPPQRGRLWSRARLWRRKNRELFDLVAGNERRRFDELVQLGIDSERRTQLPVALDIVLTFLTWLYVTTLYDFLGAVVRFAAPFSGVATGLALRLEGVIVREHWNGARHAYAHGNTGEVLRRLHHATWHLRTLHPERVVEGDDPSLRALRGLVEGQVEIVAKRFGEVWELSEGDDRNLRDLLHALVDPTIAGSPPLRGRLIKDIFKSALDLGGNYARLHLLPWLVSFGRFPLKRELPHQGQVKSLRQLRAARRKLRKLPWPVATREQLGSPLDRARLRTQGDLREQIRPILRESFIEAGLVPETPRHELALDKICEELLDKLEQNSHLLFTDLRDAIARNDLRLEDPRFAELFTGDVLSRLNKILGRKMVGLYERAEFYIRWLEQGSTAMFGTPVGRFITRYILIPYLGAYVLIMGAANIFDPISGLFGGPQLLSHDHGGHHAPEVPGDGDPPSDDHGEDGHGEGEPGEGGHGDEGAAPNDEEGAAPGEEEGAAPGEEGAPADDDGESPGEDGPEQDGPEQDGDEQDGDEEEGDGHADGAEGHHDEKEHAGKYPLENPALLYPMVVGLGTLLLFAIYTAHGRAAARWLGLAIWRSLKFLCIAPFRILHAWKPLQRILKTPAARRVQRYVLQPVTLAVLPAIPLVVISELSPDNAPPWWMTVGGTFLVGFWLANSKTGRDAVDHGVYRLEAAWRQAKDTLFVGIFHWIMELSDLCLGAVEQVIYRVDDLVRFREGESVLTVGVKAVGQVLWSGVTYILRLYVNVLIEPQVNPIKHFPVVTVSHKLMIPWLPGITIGIAHVCMFVMPDWLAYSIAVFTVFLLPGFFGFLVWELKENWKLFRANHPDKIRPVMVGSHGETTRRMLRRGFHSGTVAKAYDRVRRGLRAARASEMRPRVQRARDRLHHCEEDMMRFLERELVASLRKEDVLVEGFTEIRADRVELATQSMTLVVQLTRASGEQAVLEVHYRLVEDELVGRVEIENEAIVEATERKAIDRVLAPFFERSGAALT